MVEIPRYKSVSGVAYLEASAIRCYAVQFNYIFSGILCPRVCKRNRATCDNFQLSFRKHSPDRWILRECCGLSPVLARSVAGSKTKSPGNINTGRQPLGKWRRHRQRVDADYLASHATRRAGAPSKRNATPRNRQILLIPHINIRNWASISRRPGFGFPRIVPNTSTFRVSTGTCDGETFGKPINDATHDEKNFWNLQHTDRLRRYTGNSFER